MRTTVPLMRYFVVIVSFSANGVIMYFSDICPNRNGTFPVMTKSFLLFLMDGHGHWEELSFRKKNSKPNLSTLTFFAAFCIYEDVFFFIRETLVHDDTHSRTVPFPPVTGTLLHNLPRSKRAGRAACCSNSH